MMMPNPKSEIRNPKSEIRNPKSEMSFLSPLENLCENHEPGIPIEILPFQTAAVPNFDLL